MCDNINNNNTMKMFEEIDTFTENYIQYGQEKYGEWTEDLVLLRNTTNNIGDKFEGLIYEKNIENKCNKVVYYGINHLLVYKQEFDEYIKNNKISRVEELIEGSKVGLYYYENEWRVSTNKTINAEFSKWQSNKSFSEMAWDCLISHTKSKTKEEVIKMLNKKHCYTFVICHPENIITMKHKNTYATLINIRDTDTLEELPVDEMLDWCSLFENMKLPETIEADTSDYNKLFEGINQRGTIVVFEDNNRIKFENPIYTEIKKIKGNTKNIYHHLIHIYGKDDFNKFSELFNEYFSKEIINITKCFNDLTKFIHTEYLNKFIYKTIPVVNPYLSKFIYELHGDYIKNKKPITREYLFNFLINSDTPRKAFLIKHICNPEFLN